MSHGVIVVGTEHFEESRWHDDTLEGLLYDDVLWGYMVHICEEQRVYGVRSYGDDPVLQRLMTMGTFDWTHTDTSVVPRSDLKRLSLQDGSNIRRPITGGEGAFTQWVWVELIESTETIRPANTHQVHAEFI